MIARCVNQVSGRFEIVPLPVKRLTPSALSYNCCGTAGGHRIRVVALLTGLEDRRAETVLVAHAVPGDDVAGRLVAVVVGPHAARRVAERDRALVDLEGLFGLDAELAFPGDDLDDAA